MKSISVFLLLCSLVIGIFLVPLSVYIVLTEPAPPSNTLRWLFPINVFLMSLISLLLYAISLSHTRVLKLKQELVEIDNALDDLLVKVIAAKINSIAKENSPPSVPDQRTGSKDDREIL